MDGLPQIGVFDWKGEPLEAWLVDRRWHVRFDGRESEARRLDDALEAALHPSTRNSDSTRFTNLAVEILMRRNARAD